MTREEIIKGLLGIHAVTANYNGDQVILHNMPMKKLTGILYGAVELLTPRILTLSEITEHDGAVFIEYMNEDMRDEWMFFLAEHNPYLGFTNERANRVYLEIGTYEDRWRAWTDRPTPKQRWQS